MFGIPVVKRRYLRGCAYGASDFDFEMPPHEVRGVYEVSTVETGARRETVAFKIAGIGPDQINELQHVKTLQISDT